MSIFKSIPGVLVEAFRSWSRHKSLRLGASLPYYTIFSIAPLFIIVLAIAGFWFGKEAAQKELFSQISGMVGAQGAEAIQAIIAAANKPRTGLLATIIAALTLLMGATGVFVELQDAMNTVWEVRRSSGGGLRNFVRVRLLSF